MEIVRLHLDNNIKIEYTCVVVDMVSPNLIVSLKGVQVLLTLTIITLTRPPCQWQGGFFLFVLRFRVRHFPGVWVVVSTPGERISQVATCDQNSVLDLHSPLGRGHYVCNALRVQCSFGFKK